MASKVNVSQLVDNVREDPALTPEEKEYAITGTKAEDEVQIYSEVAGMMRRLLVHPEFVLQDVRDLVGPLEGASLEDAAETVEREGAYVNVHTEQYPDGEIRGQIVPDEEPVEEPEPEEPEEEPDEPEEEDPEEPEEEPATTADEASLSLGELNVGPGVDWEDEYITIQNVGDTTVDFSGWTLQDRRGEGIVNGVDPWEFPDVVVLEPGQEVQVFSGSGENTATEWYLDYGNHIWLQTGDTVIVEDAHGDVALEETYESQESLSVVFSFVRSLFV